MAAETGVDLSPQKLKLLGVLTPTDVDVLVESERYTQFIVKDFLPAKSVAIICGDSGIGKSPLICQLALCVASCIPFLGMPTHRGRVLYLDLENNLTDCQLMRDTLLEFLGINHVAHDFLLKTEVPQSLEQLVDALRPTLVVVDSLRAFRPDATDRPKNAAQLLKDLHVLARKFGCSFLLVHHMRKPPAPKSDGQLVILQGLENMTVLEWMQDAEGVRALMNQADVRIAVEPSHDDRVALHIKVNRRVHGDEALMRLERIFNTDGDPVGYRHITGMDSLSAERRAALLKLPTDREFSFREAREALGLTDKPTNDFLNECRVLGLINKLGRGRYRRVRTHVGS